MGDSKIEKVQNSFKALSAIASSLNSASDELTKVVVILDESLRKLNIGLEVWVDYADYAIDPNQEYDADQIGYCKVNSLWGIYLRHIRGLYHFDNSCQIEGPWLFNDAPRDMRLRSVDAIPELIEELNKKASETAAKLEQKTDEVRALAEVIGRLAKPPYKLDPIPTTGVPLSSLAGRKEGGK